MIRRLLKNLESPQSMQERRILHIEDDENFSKLCAKIWERAGYHVISEETMLGGLAAISHFKPRLVITDLRLPVSATNSAPLPDFVREWQPRKTRKSLDLYGLHVKEFYNALGYQPMMFWYSSIINDFSQFDPKFDPNITDMYQEALAQGIEFIADKNDLKHPVSLIPYIDMQFVPFEPHTPLHIMFIGPSGAGKSEQAAAFGRMTRGGPAPLSRVNELNGNYILKRAASRPTRVEYGSTSDTISIPQLKYIYQHDSEFFLQLQGRQQIVIWENWGEIYLYALTKDGLRETQRKLREGGVQEQTIQELHSLEEMMELKYNVFTTTASPDAAKRLHKSSRDLFGESRTAAFRFFIPTELAYSRLFGKYADKLTPEARVELVKSTQDFFHRQVDERQERLEEFAKKRYTTDPLSSQALMHEGKMTRLMLRLATLPEYYKVFEEIDFAEPIDLTDHWDAKFKIFRRQQELRKAHNGVRR